MNRQLRLSKSKPKNSVNLRPLTLGIETFLILTLASCLNKKDDRDSRLMIIDGKNPFTNVVDGSNKAVWVGDVATEHNGFISSCTGTLFSHGNDEYFLTAAHCLVDHQRNVVKPKAVTVSFYDPQSREEFKYGVNRLSVNPYWNEIIYWTTTSFKQRDFALMKLSKKVDPRFSRQLPTLALTSESLHSLGIPGGKFSFYGYGLTESGVLSPHLLFGQALANPWDECVDKIGDGTAFKNQKRPQSKAGPVGIFCSFTYGQGTYTGKGDSGGPAIVYRNNKSYIVGVSSNGSESMKDSLVYSDSVFEALDDPKTIAWISKFTSKLNFISNCLPFK